MKNIILFFSTVIISCNEINPVSKSPIKEMQIYFINDKSITLRPGQISEEEFWGDPENVDTLKVVDSTGEYFHKLYSLHDTVSTFSNDVDLFSHVFAFVFMTNNKPDTLYADGTLTSFEWKGRNKFYNDTTSFFKNKFASLAHY